MFNRIGQDLIRFYPNRRTVKFHVGLLTLIIALTGFTTVTLCQRFLNQTVTAAHNAIIDMLQPYKVMLKNARWPAQRYDYFQKDQRGLQPEQHSMISLQMLQLAFGSQPEYFALRSVSGHTRVEIKKGVLSDTRSPMEIYGQEEFRDSYVGQKIKPCRIAGTLYVCLLDFTDRREFVPLGEKSVILIAIGIAEIERIIWQTTHHQRWLYIQPETAVHLANKFEIPAPTKMKEEPRQLARFKEIDRDFTLSATIPVAQLLSRVGLLSTAIYGGLLLLYWLFAGTFRNMVRKRSEHLEKVQRLIRGVIHDIRSPLAALKICSTQPMDPESRIILEHAAKRMALIIRELEEKAALEFSKKTLVPMPIHFILQLVALEKTREFQNRVQITTSSQPNDLWIMGHYSELLRTLSNLINNANEACPPGLTVELSAYAVDSNLAEVCVIDRGPGVPSHILGKLFQEGVSHGKLGGKGLGLYQAKELTEEMHGNILVDTTPGQGTRVRLQLQRAVSPAWAVSQLNLQGLRKIFVVDDEESVFHNWQAKLSDQNVELIYLQSPEQLNAFRQDWKGSLILIDNRFGDQQMSGLNYVKKHNFNNYVLVTTEWQVKEVQDECRRCGIRLLGKEFIDWVPITSKSLPTAVPLPVRKPAAVRNSLRA